jgi:hypothetical protein
MFPSVIFGADGDQFVTLSTAEAFAQGSPGVGEQLVLNDSRKYRWSQAGLVAVTVAQLYQAPIPVPEHVLQTAAAAAVGATSVALTLGAVAVSPNQYNNGWLVIDLASNSGFGYTYGIKQHNSVGASGVFTVPLKASVQVAIATTANSISLIPNNYAGVILAVVTTPTAVIAGVSVKPIPIEDFGFIQTRGPAACQAETTGTIIIGEKVIPSSATTGQVMGEAAWNANCTVGYVERVATTTDYSTIDVRIDL